MGIRHTVLFCTKSGCFPEDNFWKKKTVSCATVPKLYTQQKNKSTTPDTSLRWCLGQPTPRADDLSFSLSLSPFSGPLPLFVRLPDVRGFRDDSEEPRASTP